MHARLFSLHSVCLFLSDQTEDMGNQNGTAPSGGATPEVSNNTTNNTTSSSSNSGTNSTSSNGRTNQRRATSPGMPNRAGRKAGRSVQSTAGGTPAPAPAPTPAPAPPPPTKPAHMQPQNPIQQQQQAINAQNQAKGNEFVDFIYDYATKDPKEGGETTKEEVANKKNKSFDAVVAGDLAGHREHVDKKQGRGERARAHTHGHAARKHKSPASKPNTKSTLVVDYIDASHNPQSYSTSNLTVPELTVGNDSDHQFDEFSRQKAATESKPHRERARAHSHGHRKKGASDAKTQNKHKGNGSSSESSEKDPVVNLLAVPPKPAKPTENGHGHHRSKLSSSTNELADTGREENKSHENLADVSAHDSSMEGKRPSTPPQSSTPPPGDSQDSAAELARLRHENNKLRRELADSNKSSDKDRKR